MRKIGKLVFFIFPFLLNNHCQNCQIRKRSTKSLKSQNAVTLKYLISVYLDALCLSCLSRRSLVLYQRFTNFWTFSLWKVTAQKMKFCIKDFFRKCDQIRSFTEEILNGKPHFLCSESWGIIRWGIMPKKQSSSCHCFIASTMLF